MQYFKRYSVVPLSTKNILYAKVRSTCLHDVIQSAKTCGGAGLLKALATHPEHLRVVDRMAQEAKFGHFSLIFIEKASVDVERLQTGKDGRLSFV